MEKKLTLRTKFSQWLSSDITQWIVIVIFIALTVWMNTAAYFFGIGFVLLLLWARRWEWEYLGLIKIKGWAGLLTRAIVLSILMFLAVDMILTPVIEFYTGAAIDISSLDGIRGDFINYVIFILFMWVVAAFGEEFVYRGLLVERLGQLFGNSRITLWIAVFISSVLFGLAHQYQGISGMLTTGAVGFLLGIIFINNRNRLWLTILTHGIYDMIGITLIYFDIEQDVYYVLKSLII